MSAVDERFDLAEATVAVMRLIQVHDLDFTSVQTEYIGREGRLIVHVPAHSYPAWVETATGLRDITLEPPTERVPDRFRTTSTVDVNGHTIELLVYLPVATFIPTSDDQAVA